MVWGDDLSANKLKKTYVKGDLDVSAGNLIVQNSGNLMVMSQTEGLASITFSTTNINVFDGLNQYDMSYSTFGALNAIGVSFEESTGELLLRTKYISSSTISDIRKTLIGNVDTSCSLFVYGNTVCTMDSSINGVIRVGGGAFVGGALDVVEDASLNQMLFVGGDSSLNGFLTVVRDASLNSGLRVGGDSSLNGLLTVTRDVSFGAGLRVGGDSSLNGFLTVAKDVSFGAGLHVGGDSSLNGYLTVARDASLNSGLQVGGDSSLNGYLTVVKDASFGAGLRVGGDSSLNGLLTVTKDASLNAGLRVGGDSSLNGFLTVVKDVSFGAGLRVGGDVSFNGLLTVIKDASLNAGLRVGGDVSLNGFLTVVKDASLNAGLMVGGDSSLNGFLTVVKDVSFGAGLHVGGDSSLNGFLTVIKDVSLNAGLMVGGDSSLNGFLTVVKDVSFGAGLLVGGGSSLNGFLKVIKEVSFGTGLMVGCDSSLNGFLTVIKDVSFGAGLLVGGDVSLNENLYVKNAIGIGKDASDGYILDVSGLSLFTDTMYIVKDPSIGDALDISGSLLVRDAIYIIKDASTGYALDVSGSSLIRDTMYIVKDPSVNYALDVSGRTVLRGPLVINKDISAGYMFDASSGYMLDVSGITQFRGNVDISGLFTIYGQPLQAGASLTGNVQVGTNSGYVTVDKPQFYSDPSLFIFYTFDTSFNGGTSIANSGFGGATYDASLGPNGGSTNGVIDTSIKRYGTASLKNDPALSNRGAITNNVPVSTQMSFSVWINKSSKPAGGIDPFDRVFEFTSNTGFGQNENDTIALDISTNGCIYPVVIDVSTSTTNLIPSPQLVPYVNYNVCDGNWNLVTWTLNGTQSNLYVNGAIVQTDNLTYSMPDTSRNRLIIAYNSVQNRDFIGNLDNFRYYKDKVLTPVEIYQLYNNKYFTLDVCGGILANGSSLIYEPVGSAASANAGSLVLMHGDKGGTSSVMFKSNTSTSDYAYMQYTENFNRPSALKYDLSSNVPSVLTGGATIASTGRLNYPMVAAPNDNSLNWIGSQTIPNLATPVFCISFNQTNLIVDNSTSRINYLQTSGLPSFSSFSFSAWINPATIVPSENALTRWVIANLTNGTNNAVVDIWLQNNGRILTLINDDNENYMYSTASLVTGTWYHIVSTFDGTTGQGVTYINGVNSTTPVGSGLSNKKLNVNSHLIIGMKYGWNTGIGGSGTIYGTDNTFKGFHGRMAFVNIFDRSLSSEDVQYLYNNPSYVPVESGLLTIGIENDQTATNNDSIALMPASGTGFVGVNTRTPAAALDISGDILVNGVRAGRGGNAVTSNTVFGNGALPYNTTGFQNTAIGANALPINTSGYQNVAIGYNTMAYITTGSQNTAIGHNCLSGAWDVSMNTAVGLYAGSGGNNGNKNTFLGYDTQINSNYFNCTVIGAGARGTSSNQVQLGSGCIAQAQSFNATSDYREKREIADLDNSYTVDYLRPVSYKFIKNDDNLHIGFIAHEVQEHYPFLVQGVKDGPVPQSLNYNDLIGILTKELKDLKASVRELKETVSIQSSKLLLLNTTVLEQDALIQSLIKKDQLIKFKINTIYNIFFSTRSYYFIYVLLYTRVHLIVGLCVLTDSKACKAFVRSNLPIFRAQAKA